MLESNFRCGFIAVAGRPNVGKSTLINALVGAKVSIVTKKPQTTRRRILGIHSTPDAQLIYIDMPGLYKETSKNRHQGLNQVATNSMADADIVLLTVVANHWIEEDDHALSRCKSLGRPLALVVNKIDTLAARSQLIPYLDDIQTKADFEFIVPVSGLTQENVGKLETALIPTLPRSPALFPKNQLTDQDGMLRASESIREKLMRVLTHELPYSIAVGVDEYNLDKHLLSLSATIWVDREGQKAIVIGRNGSMLKRVGREVRLELEHEIKRKVFIQLWVKVRRHRLSDANYAPDIMDLGG